MLKPEFPPIFFSSPFFSPPNTLIKIADALGIEVYELLKPESIIPDNAVNILEKYTSDIHLLFGETLHNIQKQYIQQINKNIVL